MRYLTAKILQIGSYLRFFKLKSAVNFLLLRCSYYLSSMVRRPMIWGKPLFLSIEPVNFCNLHCPECPTGNGSLARAPKQMDLERIKSIIDETKSHISFINFYFQGEPFMHSQLLSAIEYAHQSRIYTSTSTNGHFITPPVAEGIVKSGLQRIVVSLDGYNQQSYEQYRKGGKYSAVLEAIGHIARAKKAVNSWFPIIEAQVLLLSSTENHLPEIKMLALQNGANIVAFKTAQFYDLKNRLALLPKHAKTRYAKNASGDFQVQGEFSTNCWRMWTNPVVCSDGSFVPCCYDKNAEFAFGNQQEESLAASWQSTRRRQFIAMFFKNRSAVTICQNCPEGRKR